MSEVPATRDVVTLSPKTVAKAEKVAKDIGKTRRKSRPKPVKAEVTRRYIKRPPGVNPEVWQAAQAAIRQHGYSEKVIVNSDQSVMVVNRG